jgi:hypothetical protein
VNISDDSGRPESSVEQTAIFIRSVISSLLGSDFQSLFKRYSTSWHLDCLNNVNDGGGAYKNKNSNGKEIFVQFFSVSDSGLLLLTSSLYETHEL